MKTIKIYTVALLAALSFFTACTKDAIVTPPGTTPITNPTSMQLLKVAQDANNYTTFSYNTDGLLAATTNVHNQASSSYATTYDADKRPVSVTVDNEIYKIIYNGDKISKVEAYDKQSPQMPSSYFAYSYTGNKVTEVDYYSIQTVNSYAFVAKTISVYNTAGDMVNQKVYYNVGSTFVLSSATTFEYDTKVNPLAGTFSLAEALFNSQQSHNIIKQTIADAEGTVDQTDTYTLTYNSNNYPTQASRKVVKPGMSDVTTVSEYTYK